LQSTELVHEAFLRLFEWQDIHWRNRAQFFALAAQIMRNILVDRARERLAIKRGSGAVRVTLVESAAIEPNPPLDLIALDNALNRLQQLNPEQTRVVELRFFGGLSVQETAQVLAISPTTVKRLWTVAKGWLYRELTARK